VLPAALAARSGRSIAASRAGRPWGNTRARGKGRIQGIIATPIDSYAARLAPPEAQTAQADQGTALSSARVRPMFSCDSAPA